jgi:hypothetical protein
MSKIIDAEDVSGPRAPSHRMCVVRRRARWGKEADQVSTALEVASAKIYDAIAMLDEYRNGKDTL